MTSPVSISSATLLSIHQVLAHRSTVLPTTGAQFRSPARLVGRSGLLARLIPAKESIPERTRE